MNVSRLKLPFALDAWQIEVLGAEGNLCINSGRQVGKSTVISVKVGLFSTRYSGKRVLIISVTEDQAVRMLQKILVFLHENFPKLVEKGRDKPTKHQITLTNGSVIVTKAVGQYGIGVLGMTVDLLVADEAAYMPEMIWPSITPMLLTTGGKLWLLSTPNSKQGFFFEAYTNPGLGYMTFHVNSEEVARQRPEPQRTIMLDYLKSERARMTELQYAQQYLAQFLEEQGRFFSEELIEACCTGKRVGGKQYDRSAFYLGVDVARMGGDEITFEILEQRGDRLIHRENIVRTYQRTTQTTDMIVIVEEQWRFAQIYVDDGGVGAGVFDQLLEHPATRRKTTAINNSARPLDHEKNRTKKLLKEDLYLNLKWLMERGRIELLADDDVAASLRSITIEYDPNGDDVRIYGRYSHIVEGLIRAAWCVRKSRLKLFFTTV